MDDAEDYDDEDYATRLFVLRDEPTLARIGQRLRALDRSALTEATDRIAPLMRRALPAHTARLREEIERRERGLAMRIDAGIEEIRRASHVLPPLRAADVATSGLCGDYVYWAYSADIIGREGVSRTAIQRQYGMGLMDHPLVLDYPCPACGAGAKLLLRASVFAKRADMELDCAACGHRTQRRWYQQGEHQQLDCPCTACAEAVRETAAEIAPLAHGLGSALARYAIGQAQNAQQRLEGVHAGERPFTYRANVALSLAGLVPPEKACAQALDGTRFRHPWDRYDAQTAILDELIAQGKVAVDCDWLVDPEDDAAVLQFVFLTRPYVSTPPEEMGQWITRLLGGFDGGDVAAFRAWVKALVELCALTHYFFLPLGFAYTWADERATTPRSVASPAEPGASLLRMPDAPVAGFVVLHQRLSGVELLWPLNVRPEHIVAFAPVIGVPNLTEVTLAEARADAPLARDGVRRIVVEESYAEVARRLRAALAEWPGPRGNDA